MNTEVNYINRIVQTTNFFFEINEEGTGGGSTQIIKLIKPHPSIGNVELRNFVLNDLFRKRMLTLTQAAFELTTWLRLRGVALPAIENEALKVRLACKPYERPASKFVEPAEIIDRAYLRLARCIRHMQTTDVGKHSRVFDFFIPAEAILRGRSRNATPMNSHPEHVVPCAYIRDVCLKFFGTANINDEVAAVDASLNEIVPIIRRLLAIVEISQEERILLDVGPNALKDRMPANWDIAAGCIFERLHRNSIAFDLLPAPIVTTACSACLS